MLVVLINGPKQSGKSTLSQGIFAILKPTLGRALSEQHLKEPLEVMLRALAKDAYPENANLAYEDLKRAKFGSVDGRAIMIEMGNMMRRLDTAWLPRVIMRKVAENNPSSNQVVIVDDCGFEDEWYAFRSAAGIEVMTIYLEERGDRLYSHGEPFDGDNRVCLRGHADFLDPDPALVAEAIMARLGE